MASAGRAAANSKCAPTLGRGTSWSDLACVFTWSAAGLPGVCQGSGGRSGRQSATSGWSPAGARGRHPASGAASGRVRPRSGIRVWQTSNISLGSGMVRRGRLPSGRIRRGLGTRVLLTCPGPADPRYWGGSSAARRRVCLRIRAWSAPGSPQGTPGRNIGAGAAARATTRAAPRRTRGRQGLRQL